MAIAVIGNLAAQAYGTLAQTGRSWVVVSHNIHGAAATAYFCAKYAKEWEITNLFDPTKTACFVFILSSVYALVKGFFKPDPSASKPVAELPDLTLRKIFISNSIVIALGINRYFKLGVEPIAGACATLASYYVCSMINEDQPSSGKKSS